MIIVNRTLWGKKLTNKACKCGCESWYALNKKRDSFGRVKEYRYKCVQCGNKEIELSSTYIA